MAQQQLKILEILKKLKPEIEFIESNDYLSDGLLDSFDVVMLTAELERVFNIQIPGDEITPENYINLEALSKLVNGLSF